MAIKLIRDENMRSIVLSVQKKPLRKQDTIADLNEALTRVSDSLSDKALDCRAIDLSGKWRLGDDEFDPWNSSNVGAWARLGGQPAALTGLRVWLEDVEKLLVRHFNDKFVSIWETDEVLLGEVPLSILAVMHLQFIPIYARFLDVWDNLDLNQRNSIVREIVEAHGRCPEVEDLLFKLVVYHSGDGPLLENALRPELEKLYGDFSKTVLFRRMVEAMHARGPELQDSEGKRYIFSYLPNWPELAEAAQTILAELDAG